MANLRLAGKESPLLSIRQPVIVIAGGTGVGTSSLGRALVPVVRASGAVGTDSLREALRAMSETGRLVLDETRRQVLDCSTYDAWEVGASEENRQYQEQASNTRLVRIDGLLERTLPVDHHGTDQRIAEYASIQATLVMDSAIGVARRAIREQFSVIIEGVHIDLRQLFDERAWRLRDGEDWQWFRRHLFPITLDCENERVHHDRLQRRDAKHRYRPEHKKAHYDTYWHAIRTINATIRAKHEHAIIYADAEKPLDEIVDETAAVYFRFKTSDGDEPIRKEIRLTDEERRRRGRSQRTPAPLDS